MTSGFGGRNENSGHFKVIPQPGGDPSNFPLRFIDITHSKYEFTDLRVIPTEQHSPAVELLHHDANHWGVGGRIPYLQESFGNTLTGSDVKEFEVNVYNANKSVNRVVVLNEVHGSGGFYKYEATAASHCVVTNREDGKHMRIVCRQASETPRMSIKLKVYEIDGDVNNDRLTKAFRRSPIQGRPCLSGSGIREIADVFVDIELVDGVFWWENSTIRCDVTAPQEPAVDDIDRYNFEGWLLKADVQGTKTFDTGNVVIGMNVAKGKRAVAGISVCCRDDF